VDAGVLLLWQPSGGPARLAAEPTGSPAHLDAFITTRPCRTFGDYQDALTQQGWRVFHSLLSFALNTKMLNRTGGGRARPEQAWVRRGHAPLAAVEGFIRQILGWREYVRGVYWAHMPGYVTHNALDHTLPLPEWFWTGDTRMRCLPTRSASR
jgi:deoxyribodipyrimidine photolyase-related protein